MFAQKKDKILIISTNAIGDAYLSMSAIEPLEREYGNVEFTFIFPMSAKALKIDKDTSHKILYARKSLFNFIIIISKLLIQKFDFAFSFFPGRYNTFLLKLSNSKNKGGYYNYKKIERWDDKILYPTIYRQGKMEFANKWSDNQNYLELINSVLRYFVNDDKIKKYKPSVVKKISAIDNSVLIHGISRTEDRSLTNLQFKLIVTFLIEHGIKNINILGAKKENEKIKKNLNNTRVSFLSDLSLQELVLELNDSIFIGVDSFPLHVADAYNANFIGLFTCTKPEAVLTNINKSIKFKKKSFSEVSPQEFVEKLEKVKAYFSK